MYIRILFDLLAVGNADHHIILCCLHAFLHTYIESVYSFARVMILLLC